MQNLSKIYDRKYIKLLYFHSIIIYILREESYIANISKKN